MLTAINMVWFWLALAGVLLIAELATGAYFCLFLAMALALTAAITWLLPIGFFTQTLVLLACSAGSIALWKLYFKQNPLADNNLNDKPFAHFIGQSVVIDEDVVAHQPFRLRLGDTTWQAVAPCNISQGSTVVVTDIADTVVKVSPVATLAQTNNNVN
jgi:inner membrane protein